MVDRYFLLPNISSNLYRNYRSMIGFVDISSKSFMLSGFEIQSNTKITDASKLFPLKVGSSTPLIIAQNSLKNTSFN
jgi:hypothetical protein